MISLNGYVIKPTIFPDGTSQVWKLPKEAFEYPVANVIWKFEMEAEFLHLAQLKQLIDARGFSNSVLDIPFLPYARQDKLVSNEATFALKTFGKLLNSLKFDTVYSLDPHNLAATKECINNFETYYPYTALRRVAMRKYVDVIVYPDIGAYNRYSKIYDFAIPVLKADKIRNQTTGAIEGLTIDATAYAGKTALIVDDICDGGRTFIELASALKRDGVKSVILFVTHGIFSKGVSCLREAGIDAIFTAKGEVFEAKFGCGYTIKPYEETV